jgi:hypothetical protein
MTWGRNGRCRLARRPRVSLPPPKENPWAISTTSKGNSKRSLNRLWHRGELLRRLAGGSQALRHSFRATCTGRHIGKSQPVATAMALAYCTLNLRASRDKDPLCPLLIALSIRVLSTLKPYKFKLQSPNSTNCQSLGTHAWSTTGFLARWVGWTSRSGELSVQPTPSHSRSTFESW